MSLAAMPLNAVGSPRLDILRLTLSDFRSYACLRLDLDASGPPMIVLAGPNGAGKTNLLEALSFMTPGRGLRGARLDEAARIGAGGGWAVHARLATLDRTVEIGTGLVTETEAENGAPASQRRRVRIDGESASGPAALGRHVAMLWLTPAMDRLFTDAASGRRRFFDRMVLAMQGEHGRQLAGFERAMRERNRLLVERGAGADPAWLGALEARMAEHGVAIAAARREAAQRLDRRAAAEPAGPFPRPRVAVEGALESALERASALETEETYRERLAQMRARDAAAGRTLEGPHRSDLAVYHAAGGMPAHLCSTGEQKGLLVALVLAQAALSAERAGRAPVLLFDEVAAHLDADRRAALLGRLQALGCQAWLTGTEAALFAPLNGAAQAFSVADSALTPMEL